MKILVTGATGFIGREIVAELSENDYQVIGLSRKKKDLSVESSNVTFFQADISNYESLVELENDKDIEIIVHSAGLAHQFGDTKREEFEAVNVKGTKNTLKLAVKLGVKHFILIGSTAVYGFAPSQRKSGENPKLIDENTVTKPQTLYAESKLEGEEVCRKICEENQIPLTIFRLAPVIGEDNVGNVARLIGAIDRKRFLWIGNGENLKSLIYKRDVARACLELIEKKRGGTEIFNLAAEPVLMKDFVGQIADNLNRKIPPLKIPAAFLRVFFKINARTVKLRLGEKLSDTIEKWLSDDVYDVRKIAEVYGFKSSTSISDALKKQVEFYKNHSKKEVK